MTELKILSYNTQGLGGIKKQLMFSSILKIKKMISVVYKIHILQRVKKYT